MDICNFKAHEFLVLKRKKSGKNITQEKFFQLWMVPDIKAPPQISQIFCARLGIPIQEGMPLKAYQYINGKEVSDLDTLTVERRVLPTSTFKPLSGYKKVKDEIEVIMGESASQNISDLLDIPTTKVDKNDRR
jgi:hypothetical protein